MTIQLNVAGCKTKKKQQHKHKSCKITRANFNFQAINLLNAVASANASTSATAYTKHLEPREAVTTIL